MANDAPDPNEIISDTAAKIFAEPVDNMLSPPTKELGKLLGTVANLCRYYATKHLEKIFTKWAEHRHGEPLNAEDFSKVMPLLPQASMVSDDELQEKWARLMETATKDGGHAAAFGQTLAQLSVEEVRFLDQLWAIVSTPSRIVTTYIRRMQPLSFTALVGAIDPCINTGVNDAEFQIYGHRWSEQQKANYEKLQHAELIIDHAVRLGILRETQKMRTSDRVIGMGAVNVNRSEVEIKGGKIEVHTNYSFSPYGVSFMEAVTGDDSKK